MSESYISQNNLSVSKLVGSVFKDYITKDKSVHSVVAFTTEGCSLCDRML